jgi:hypothetical protein
MATGEEGIQLATSVELDPETDPSFNYILRRHSHTPSASASVAEIKERTTADDDQNEPVVEKTSPRIGPATAESVPTSIDVLSSPYPPAARGSMTLPLTRRLRQHDDRQPAHTQTLNRKVSPAQEELSVRSTSFEKLLSSFMQRLGREEGGQSNHARARVMDFCKSPSPSPSSVVIPPQFVVPATAPPVTVAAARPVAVAAEDKIERTTHEHRQDSSEMPSSLRATRGVSIRNRVRSWEGLASSSRPTRTSVTEVDVGRGNKATVSEDCCDCLYTATPVVIDDTYNGEDVFQFDEVFVRNDSESCSSTCNNTSAAQGATTPTTRTDTDAGAFVNVNEENKKKEEEEEEKNRKRSEMAARSEPNPSNRVRATRPQTLALPKNPSLAGGVAAVPVFVSAAVTTTTMMGAASGLDVTTQDMGNNRRQSTHQFSGLSSPRPTRRSSVPAPSSAPNRRNFELDTRPSSTMSTSNLDVGGAPSLILPPFECFDGEEKSGGHRTPQNRRARLRSASSQHLSACPILEIPAGPTAHSIKSAGSVDLVSSDGKSSKVEAIAQRLRHQRRCSVPGGSRYWGRICSGSYAKALESFKRKCNEFESLSEAAAEDEDGSADSSLPLAAVLGGKRACD